MSGKRKSGRQTLTEIFTVARDPDVTLGSKVLWLIYRSYDGKGNGAFPGDELVASHLNCSQRTVQRWRAELMESGHLRQKLDGPKAARYHAVLPQRDDTGGEALPKEETTPVSDQVTERDDTRGEPSCDDATPASPDDATPVAPHSTGSTLSTSVSSSLRSQETAGRGRPARSKSSRSGERTDAPTRCPRCGDPLHDPAWAACMACVRAEAGLPRGASRPFQEVAL